LLWNETLARVGQEELNYKEDKSDQINLLMLRSPTMLVEFLLSTSSQVKESHFCKKSLIVG